MLRGMQMGSVNAGGAGIRLGTDYEDWTGVRWAATAADDAHAEHQAFVLRRLECCHECQLIPPFSQKRVDSRW